VVFVGADGATRAGQVTQVYTQGGRGTAGDTAGHASWQWGALGTADSNFEGCSAAENAMHVSGRLPRGTSLRVILSAHKDGMRSVRCACPSGTMCSGKRCRAAVDTTLTRPAIHAFTLPVDDAQCVPIPDYGGPASEVSERWRRAKINRHIYEEGFGTRFCYCNAELIQDLEGWLARRNLSKLPLRGPLQVHGFWKGSLQPKAKDFKGMLDSFLSTNEPTSVYNLWLDAMPNQDAVMKEYSNNPRIRLRLANTTMLAKGTCLENRADILSPREGQFTQGFSDMVRLLILAKHGGVWADADTVFLRDLRPFMEVAGEFLSLQCSLTGVFNNNAMGFRAGSANVHTLLNLLCAMGPWPADHGEYVRKARGFGGDITGMHQWYWNDGLLRSAVKQHNADPVRLPMSFFDPGWMCKGAITFGGGFAYNTTDQEFRERMEVSRGCAMLHTRSTHPEFDNRIYLDTSYAGRLYRLAKDRVAAGEAGVPLGPFGPRNPEETRKYTTWRALHSIADPPFDHLPKGKAVQFVTADNRCLAWSVGGDDKVALVRHCSLRHLNSIWVVSASNETLDGKTGYFIRGQDWRSNRCLTVFPHGRALHVKAETCLQKPRGRLWRHGDDGTIRSTVDSFKSCLAIEESGKQQDRHNVCMDACGRALKTAMKHVPPGVLSAHESRTTEKEFPEGFRKSDDRGKHHDAQV